MDLSQISLRGIDYIEPDEFLTSDAIESDLGDLYRKLKLPFGRIEMQTGIKSRGIFNDLMPSDISAMAAKKLFKSHDISPDSIDLLIHASVCRDFLEPSTASVIHHKLGLKQECFSFDLSNACLGVVNAIAVASQMINSGSIKKALIVTGENATPLIMNTIKTLKNNNKITRKTIKKYFANFTIGSAGVALVITKKTQGLPCFTYSQALSDTSAHELCQGDGSMEGLVMETDSEALMLKGVELAKENWNRFLRKTNSQNNDYNHIICHQVGIHHQKYLYKELGLDLDKDFSTFPKYGNTGSAALPLTLARAVKEKIFKERELIALLGIGSGLHTAMLGLEWN
jgi:3-oxoacyl-[acyl-carrier-protein] synthase III